MDGGASRNSSWLAYGSMVKQETGTAFCIIHWLKIGSPKFLYTSLHGVFTPTFAMRNLPTPGAVGQFITAPPEHEHSVGECRSHPEQDERGHRRHDPVEDPIITHSLVGTVHQPTPSEEQNWRQNPHGQREAPEPNAEREWAA